MGTGDITILSCLSGCPNALQNIIVGDEAYVFEDTKI
jgi:hypothetical protein